MPHKIGKFSTKWGVMLGVIIIEEKDALSRKRCKNDNGLIMSKVPAMSSFGLYPFVTVSVISLVLRPPVL